MEVLKYCKDGIKKKSVKISKPSGLVKAFQIFIIQDNTQLEQFLIYFVENVLINTLVSRNAIIHIRSINGI